MYGLEHSLILTRNNDDEAIYRGANNAAGNPLVAGKVELSKVSWFMPHVTPADQDKMELYKIIERKEKIPVGFRMIECFSGSVPQATSFDWRVTGKSAPNLPRYIIVGFQTDKENNQDRNPSIFDNVNVSNIYAMINSERYPTVDYNISFLAQKFSRVYGDVAEFRSKFFNLDDLVSNPNITPSDYKALYPLFLFDVSKQKDKLKTTSVDMKIMMHFSRNVPANTIVYAVVISDRLINIQSDGNKISVIT